MTRVPPADPTTSTGGLMKLIYPVVSSRPGKWFYREVASRFDAQLMRATGGRLNSGFGVLPTIVLTARGAKSGQPRSVPLVYFTDGDDVILVASSFGRPKPPLWHRNLTVNPDCELYVGKRGGRYRATEVTGADRERLYTLAQGLYEGYGDYALATSGIRTIPVLRLSPQS